MPVVCIVADASGHHRREAAALNGREGHAGATWGACQAAGAAGKLQKVPAAGVSRHAQAGCLSWHADAAVCLGPQLSRSVCAVGMPWNGAGTLWKNAAGQA